MFNLILGFTDGTADASRVFESTEAEVLGYIEPGGSLDPSRVLNLPTIVMPETGDGGSRQVARIGRIASLTRSQNQWRYQFVATPGIAEVPNEVIVAAASDLDIGRFEFTRHHWAVKDRDLLGTLLGRLLPTMAPKVFALPSSPPEPDLVAVMMPFTAAFGPVYQALQDAVDAAGMRCQRADDIWEHDAIMNDIASLIWRSRVVISDLSGKNPNVFYETGIAHTLGRDVVLITQSRDDVPFDTQHLRHIAYHPNGEGLGLLKKQVTARLRSLATAS